MLQKDRAPSKVVLLGLADMLAAELREVLSEQGQEVYLAPPLPALTSLRLVHQVHADLVFCAAQPEQYLPLLQAIKQERPDLPVVVVSRVPEVPEWLEALEVGACDYCAPPFESAYIRWIVETSLRTRHAA